MKISTSTRDHVRVNVEFQSVIRHFILIAINANVFAELREIVLAFNDGILKFAAVNVRIKFDVMDQLIGVRRNVDVNAI
jgi:hypothetical protein